MAISVVYLCQIQSSSSSFPRPFSLFRSSSCHRRIRRREKRPKVQTRSASSSFDSFVERVPKKASHRRRWAAGLARNYPVLDSVSPVFFSGGFSSFGLSSLVFSGAVLPGVMTGGVGLSLLFSWPQPAIEPSKNPLDITHARNRFTAESLSADTVPRRRAP